MMETLLIPQQSHRTRVVGLLWAFKRNAFYCNAVVAVPPVAIKNALGTFSNLILMTM